MRTLTSLVVALALALPAVGQAQCPLAPGAYTLTQHGDGFFVAGALGDVRFPPVTVIPLELGPPDAACVHPVVIPVDGTAVSDPVCLQGLGLTLQVSRSGCGVGLFDSDGGNDFTLEQVGDTSDASPACNRPHAFCQAGADDFVRSDVSMGNGSPDDCGQSRHGQLVLTVQAQFLIWHDSGGCPAPDGAFNVSQGDTLVAQLSSVVNLTTGSAHGKFADLDGDACFLAVGEGSLAELEQSGSCMDPSSRLLQLAAAQPISTSGSIALDDSIVGINVPFRLSGAQPASGATCLNPPPSPILVESAIQCGGPLDVSFDKCETARTIPTLPFTDVVLTTDATFSPDEGHLSCGFALSNHSVWYRITARQPGTITASTLGSDYDTQLAAYTGTCEGLTAEVACNDDFDGRQSLISFPVVAGETYLLQVAAAGSAGTLRLFVDSSSANCGNRIVDADEGEECDDGNTEACDGCSPKCLVEVCGDGIACFTQNEFCDDANAVSGDGCAECRSECENAQDCRAVNCMEGECVDSPLPGAPLLKTCQYRRVANCALCTHQSHCDDGDPCTADRCTVDGCQNSAEVFAKGFGAATCALKRFEAVDEDTCAANDQRRLVCAECDLVHGVACYPRFVHQMNHTRARICQRLKKMCESDAGKTPGLAKAQARVKRARKQLTKLASRVALHQAFAPEAEQLTPECARLLFDRWTQAADQLRLVKQAMRDDESLEAMCFVQGVLRCDAADEQRCTETVRR